MSEIDMTAAGPQYVLPGAERKGAALWLAAKPMQASAPQKPCDHGLFSDSAAQIDLEDLIARAKGTDG
jgi:hypothetical protein